MLDLKAIFKTPPSYPLRAAVMIPLIEAEDELHVLFEVRAHHLEGQPGEVCFPGGHLEAGETLIEAAVREVCEELIVTPDDIEVLGIISVGSHDQYHGVGVCVGLMKHYPMTYSSDEVDHVFTVPLSYFLTHEPEVYEINEASIPIEPFPYHYIPEGRHYPWRRVKRSIYFYPELEEMLWGMSAAMIYHFVKYLKESNHVNLTVKGRL